MTRPDGVHGPQPEIKFIDDWSVLQAALDELRRARDDRPIVVGVDPALPSNMVFQTVARPYQVPSLPVPAESVDALLHYVPTLRDAYAELWELTSGLMRAVEAQQASKNDFYVPDADDMVSEAYGRLMGQ